MSVYIQIIADLLCSQSRIKVSNIFYVLRFCAFKQCFFFLKKYYVGQKQYKAFNEYYKPNILFRHLKVYYTYICTYVFIIVLGIFSLLVFTVYVYVIPILHIFYIFNVNKNLCTQGFFLTYSHHSFMMMTLFF